jgi:CxxC motif-containing protein (DUF1111 family)
MSTTAALGATPDYSGTVCPVPEGVRIEIHTDTGVTNMLIYPTPPGNNAGWWMNQEAPGVFSHVASGVAPEDPFSFHLLIQNPTQYQYPSHELVIASDCIHFERNDVTPPPPRGSRHEFLIEPEGLLVRFKSGSDSQNFGETSMVKLNYRIAEGTLDQISMNQIEPGIWEVVIPEAVKGDRIEYWFGQLIGIQPQDTGLFTRTIGEEPDEPDWPVISTRSGRFRHRHPNEWRFDNYVEDYGVGKSYELTLTDWGNRVDVELSIDEDLPVNRVDFRYFTWNDPFSDNCSRPETLVNQIMSGGQNHFTHAVEEVTPGTIIDFDLTFIELPTPGLQYYSEFFYYRVGSGTYGPHESNPRITSSGEATVAHVYSPRFGFAQHSPTLSLPELKEFMDGKVTFETDFDTSELLNFSTHFDCCAGPIGQPIDSSPAFQSGILGPRYAAASCIQCHVMDGRAPTPQPGQALIGLLAQTSIPGQGSHGEPLAHPLYGNQLDIAAEGKTIIEGRLQVSYEDLNGFFDDGTPYTLRKPIYEFHDMAHGSLGTNLPDMNGSSGYQDLAEFSPRIAPMLVGLGLLEAVDEVAILAMEDPQDADGDGISGRANRVWNQQTESLDIGRFGWKANQPTIIQQTAEAFRRDLGITTHLTPEHDCGDSQQDCDPGNGLPELAPGGLEQVTAYVQGLALPPRRNYSDPMAIAGLHLFKAANCQSCHVPRLQTGSTHAIVSYRNKTIEPFTDMLLHDMGDGLADGRPQFKATGNEWRTPPLWGLSYVKHVLGVPATCEDPSSGGAEPNFMHDGRARSLMEAILWHGGEAEASRSAVLAMDATQRAQLISFVGYPFADAIFDDDSPTTCTGDINGDGAVSLGDLLQLLQSWGGAGDADLNDDGTVNSDDLGYMLSHWGSC